MTYKPGFDMSTLHYANKAISWLNGDDSQVPVLRILRDLKQFAIWNQEDQHSSYYNLNKLIARIEGHIEEANGLFRYNRPPKDDRKSEQVIQLTFSLLCLASVIEAIILGEEIFYLPGTHYRGFSLGQVAPYLRAADKNFTSIWKRVTKVNQEEYREWVENGPLSSLHAMTAACCAVEDLAVQSLCMPFIDLGGHLYDTSEGCYTPLAIDTDAPVNYPDLDTDDLHTLIPITPLNWTSDMVHRLGRMLGYLINGLCYQEISFLSGVDYVANPYRSPFLFGIHSASGPSDRETILRALQAAVGYAPEATDNTSIWRELDLQHEKVSYSYMLFALTVSNSSDVMDLLPSAYRLRETLKPLRDYIQRNGWDGRFDEGMRDLLLRLQQKRKFIAGSETKWLVSIPLPTQNLEWLYTPHYLFRPWIRSVRVVADQYRGIASLSERIEKIVERSLRKS